MAQIHLDWDDQLSSIEKWFMFSFGIFFIILPLIGNLIQLHNAIDIWMRDTHSKHTVQAWMRSYLHVLYMMAILLGSAFVRLIYAIQICFICPCLIWD